MPYYVANLGYNNHMARPKGSKNKPKENPPKKEWKGKAVNIPVNLKPDIQEKIVEVIKEVIKEVPEKKLGGFELYVEMKNAGFPQGGVGTWQEDYNGTERVYIPHPSEVYQMFLANPEQWDAMRDAICREWLRNRNGH